MADKVAVIGGGIVGLAAAWREAARGHDVVLFERHERAQQASVRNFGMVWPIGQPTSYMATAIKSRELWLELLAETGLWHSAAGSLFVARRDDEWQVLNEFADTASDYGYECELLTAAGVCRRSPAVVADGLIGGMASSTELGVDPRQVVREMPKWLADRYGVQFEYNTTISQIDMPRILSTDGRQWSADRATVASGADFETLYPQVFAEHAFARCKLQMMRTAPQPKDWCIGPHIASGLTLRHYTSFDHCASLVELKHRVAKETPELDRFGIHVMATQNGAGEAVLGDSHEYGSDISPFDKDEITGLILRELKQLIDLPNWTLAARWHGIYAVRPGDGIQFLHQVQDGVTIDIATGGCGMTMSFGLAEKRVSGH